KIGFVFQQFNLLARNTALENVELPLVYRGNMPHETREELAAAALEAVPLADRMEHRRRDLSAWHQQRVAIARALVTNPALLLADEPTGNLDSHSSREIMTLFEELNRKGITIIVVTHESDVAAHTHRVMTIRDGLLASDTRQEPVLAREEVAHGYA
ncbi:MAG TPA: ABC transporter ATP-binding protein, partial [Chloroflexia bacterium]|nr:ABC transporter ATP-binding protein [Chloroflexia bacterium]